MTGEERPKGVPWVQADNERVRVTKWSFTPGAATGWHRHDHDYVVVPLTTGILRMHGAEGATDVPVTAGEIYWRKAGVEHDVENANDFDFAFVEVEVK